MREKFLKGSGGTSLKKFPQKKAPYFFKAIAFFALAAMLAGVSP